MLDQRAAADKLTVRRRRAAEHRWRCYDFGREIVSFGDWTQHGRDSSHWRRPVKLRVGCAEVEVAFAVSFAMSTNHMLEAYAETVGNPPLLMGQWSDDERRDG
jgi:predicted metallo-beta-lactamase superfamily hydrolase